MNDGEGTPFTYSESERLGQRIAALLRNGFSPLQAAEIVAVEYGLKPGKPPKYHGNSGEGK